MSTLNEKRVLITGGASGIGKIMGRLALERSAELIIWDINTNAPMHITGEFLHGMLNQNSGHICNIASSAGLISNPKMSAYAVSKWAVIGWSDSLGLR